MTVELKINDVEIYVEDICVMHVDGNSLLIKFTRSQINFEFKTENEAIEIMEALERLNVLATN